MARNTKRPINFSEGVTAQVKGKLVTFEGKKGSMDLDVHSEVNVEANEESILFSPANDTKDSVTLTSTMRSLAKNIIEGVSEGFEKKLEINGVGYRVKVNGNKVELSLGYSHPINYDLPDGITAESPSQTELVLNSSDKQLLGDVASKIRSFRPPEPYKGKGVRYADEQVKRKEAKKAAGAGA